MLYHGMPSAALSCLLADSTQSQNPLAVFIIKYAGRCESPLIFVFAVNILLL